MTGFWTRANSAALLALGLGIATPSGAQEAGHTAPHYTYQGEDGPAHWSDLAPEFATCELGRTQSPVALPGTAPVLTDTLTFAYHPSPLALVNNGHTVQATYAPGSSLAIDGKTYAVAQFHFHAPSEHTIDGVASALEMHIVHVADDGALAVVGVLFDLAETDNGFLAGFWNILPAAGERIEADVAIDVATAFDMTAPLVTYPGSLTTPPCSEGVRWLVSTARETLSRAQLAAFVQIVGFNARPVQPLNDRTIGGVGP